MVKIVAGHRVHFVGVVVASNFTRSTCPRVVE